MVAFKKLATLTLKDGLTHMRLQTSKNILEVQNFMKIHSSQPMNRLFSGEIILETQNRHKAISMWKGVDGLGHQS